MYETPLQPPAGGGEGLGGWGEREGAPRARAARAAAPDARVLTPTRMPIASGLPASSTRRRAAADSVTSIAALSGRRARAGASATRPALEKLQVLVRASETLRALLEADLSARGVDLGDVDFGADDLLPMMASLLATAVRRGDGDGAAAAARDLPAHLAYIHVCLHPEASGLEHSSFGYTLANYEQVLSWDPSHGTGRREGAEV